MEMALGGRPDDSAKMVCSRGCIAYLFQSPLKRQRNFRLTESWGGPGLWLQQFLQHLRCGIWGDVSADPTLVLISKAIQIVSRRLGRASGVFMLQFRCSKDRNMKPAR